MGTAHSLLVAGNFGSPLQLLILLAIVLLLFGGNRLRNLGSDIGGAIKGFKNAMSDGDKEKAKLTDETQNVIEGSKVETKTEKSNVNNTDNDQHKS